LLVPAIGTAVLPKPRPLSTFDAAIAVSAITVRADQECCATLRSRTKPLSQNHFAVFRHASMQAALDNRNGFVAPLNHLWFVATKVADPGTSSRQRRGSFRLHDTIQSQNVSADDRTDDSCLRHG
jgi:hypothetical protein